MLLKNMGFFIKLDLKLIFLENMKVPFEIFDRLTIAVQMFCKTLELNKETNGFTKTQKTREGLISHGSRSVKENIKISKKIGSWNVLENSAWN